MIEWLKAAQLVLFCLVGLFFGLVLLPVFLTMLAFTALYETWQWLSKARL